MTPKEQAAALAKCGGCGAGGVKERHFEAGTHVVWAYCPTCRRVGRTKLWQRNPYSPGDSWTDLVTEAHALMYAAVPA